MMEKSFFHVYINFVLVLFFLMLVTLGLGSATGLCNGVISVVCDQWPNLSKVKVTTGFCIAGFIIGLVYVTPVRTIF